MIKWSIFELLDVCICTVCDVSVLGFYEGEAAKWYGTVACDLCRLVG